MLKINNLSNKQILTVILVFSLISRLGYGFYMFQNLGTCGFCDDWDYISYANQIIEQGIWVKDISKLLDARGGPGFPLIIAVLFALFGENYLAVVILNAIISSLITILIYKLGEEIFNKKVGLISSIWSIFYILHIRYIPTVLKEVLLAFIFSLIIYLFILETKRCLISWKSLLLPILYGFFIHIDERYFVYFPILIFAFIILDNESRKNGIKKATLFLSIVLLLMIPWILRNYYVYKRPIILTEMTAKFTDRIFGYDEEIKKRDVKSVKQIEFYESITDSILSGMGVKSSGGRVEGIKKGISLGYIPHTYNGLENWYAEFKELWRPIRFNGGYVGGGYRFEGPSWSLKHNLTEGLTYGILLPFFLIGLYFVFKSRNKYGIFILLIIFTHTIIHTTLAWARNRYRIPIDAFIIVIAFYGIQQLYFHFKYLKKSRYIKIMKIS